MHMHSGTGKIAFRSLLGNPTIEDRIKMASKGNLEDADVSDAFQTTMYRFLRNFLFKTNIQYIIFCYVELHPSRALRTYSQRVNPEYTTLPTKTVYQ